MDRLTQLVQQAAKHIDNHDIAAAERLAREVLAADPQNINGLRIMGAVTRKQGLLQRSLEYFTQAVQLNDKKAVLHFELGTAYTELNQSDDAYRCYLRAIQLDPTLQVACVNLSAVSEQHHRYEEAIEWARRAIALKPNCGLAYYNLANAQRELGRLGEAITHYELALKHKPEHAKTYWNLAICQLLSGNFAEGWRLFEYRRDAGEVFFDTFPQPRWDGSSLAGKTIVVHAEQGIGDEVLFATCFSEVVKQAGHVILTCDPRLERLFARSFPQATVYGWLRRKDWSPRTISEYVDFQIPAGSLPLYLRRSANDFPRQQSLLTVDPWLKQQWRDRFDALGAGLKIGISWRAGGKPIESQKRTIPLQQWRDIFDAPGARFINLQYGDASGELAAVAAAQGVTIHDFEDGDPLVDVDSFAAKLAALDLVISVGNATVHLAGAVGVEAWAMLPVIPSWRWMAAGDESIWYRSVRLVRQTAIGDWTPVLDLVATMLREKLGISAATVCHTASRQMVHDQSGAVSTPSSTFDAKARSNDTANEIIGDLLEVAEQLRAEEKLSEAEARYRDILSMSPRHVAALTGLGKIARRTGRIDLAIRSFRRVVAMIDLAADHHFNLADALADAGRWQESLESYERGLALHDGNPAAHLQAARMLLRLNRAVEAEAHLRRSAQIAPGFVDSLIELGQLLLATCRTDDAIEQLQQAVAAAPMSAAAHHALGAALMEDQQFAEAVPSLRRALELDPSLTQAPALLARALRNVGEMIEAIALLKQLVAHHPSNADAALELAALLREQEDLGAALSILERAVVAAPGQAQLLNLLGIVLRERGDTADAIECFDDALQFAAREERAGGMAEARLNRGLALLQSGQLADGWREYSARWQSAGAGQPPRLTDCPTWDGGSLRDKTILICGEQSLADELMFASCYPDLIARSQKVVIACDPRLETLMRRSFPSAHISSVARGRRQNWRPPAGLNIDVEVLAGDVPRLIRQSLSQFPREAFLAADPRQQENWRERLTPANGSLTIAIEGPTETAAQYAAAFPWREAISALKAVRAARVIDVSAAPEAAMTKAAAEFGLRIERIAAPGAGPDIDQLAAILAGCDALVCGGGTSAHIAGGLGLPTFVLLSRAHWRWIGTSGGVAWYPRMTTYLRSHTDGWTDPIGQLRQDLLKLSLSKADLLRMRTISGPHWSLAPSARSDREPRPSR